jgi:hypothetical protein
MKDTFVVLVRQAILTVLDEANPRTPGLAWDFNDDEQRVDFADRVASFLPSALSETVPSPEHPWRAALEGTVERMGNVLDRIRDCVRIGQHGEWVVTLDEPHDREDVKARWDEALRSYRQKTHDKEAR